MTNPSIRQFALIFHGAIGTGQFGRRRFAKGVVLVVVSMLMACSSTQTSDDEFALTVDDDPSHPVWGDPLADLPEVLDAAEAPEESAPPAAQQPPASDEAPPEETDAPAPPSEDQLEHFAVAYMSIVDLNEEYQDKLATESTEEGQAELISELEARSLEILTVQGLTTEEFNRIGGQLEADQDLRQRVQAIIDAHSTP